MSTILIITDPSDTASQNKNLITAFLRGKGWDLWHWFDDVWIISNAPETVTAPILGKEIEEIAPTIPSNQYLVLRFRGDTPEYFGRARKEIWDWIFNHFGPPTPPAIPPPRAE